MGSTVAAVEETAPWGGVVGPCVTGRVAAELLGVNRDDLDRQRRSRRVLAVATASGRWVYPAAQLRTTAGRTVTAAGLGDVLEVLLEVADGVAAARWMATPNRRLDGRTPWATLDDDPDDVLAAAAAQAGAWSGQP